MTIAPQGKVLEAAENEGAAQGGAARAAPRAPAAAGARVEIPAGKLVAGSTPGDRGRDPHARARLLLGVDLGAFSIDRVPYPNDPARSPRSPA